MHIVKLTYILVMHFIMIVQVHWGGWEAPKKIKHISWPLLLLIKTYLPSLNLDNP